MVDNRPQQLQQYIAASVAQGHTKDQIVQELRQAGWTAESIDQAFARVQYEHATSVPPITASAAHAKTNRATILASVKQQPLVQEIGFALTLGLVSALLFKLILPPPLDQMLANYTGGLAGSVVPVIMFLILIVAFVLGLVAALILRFAFRRTEAFSVIPVSFFAVFLALIIEQDHVVGLRFILSLIVMYPVSQLAWHFTRKPLALRMVFIITTIALLLLSIRVLNVAGS